MELRVDFSPVADGNGVIRDRSAQYPPVRIRITEARVRTTTGCSGRAHTGRARFTGGATFDSGPKQMVDCEELIVPMNLVVPMLQETVMDFEIDGFQVGETVEVVGILVYQPIFFFRDFGLTPDDARHLPGLQKLGMLDDVPLADDAGARINFCKSLIYRWFALFDIRSRRMGHEIAELLADEPLIQFPDAELRSAQQFRQWYDERFPLVTRGYHEIGTVRVELNGPSRARVELTPLLHAELANGQQVKMRYDIRAELSDVHTLSPRIQRYTATPLPGPADA